MPARKLSLTGGAARSPAKVIQREKMFQLAASIRKAHLAGFTLQEITDQLNNDEDRAAEPKLTLDVVKNLERRYVQLQRQETSDEMQRIVFDRIEMIFKGLVKGVRAGNPRSAEVALRALESQRQLLGLDKKDQEQAIGSQTININVGAHPDDPEAQRLLAEHVAALRPVNRRRLKDVRPPIEGALLDGSDSGAGGGDGSGEDFLRSSMGLEGALRPEDSEA